MASRRLILILTSLVSIGRCVCSIILVIIVFLIDFNLRKLNSSRFNYFLSSFLRFEAVNECDKEEYQSNDAEGDASDKRLPLFWNLLAFKIVCKAPWQWTITVDNQISIIEPIFVWFLVSSTVICVAVSNLGYWFLVICLCISSQSHQSLGLLFFKPHVVWY